MRTVILVLCVAASLLPVWARDESLVAYPSPVEMAIAANGRRLYVVCEGTDEVVELDPVAGVVLRRVRVGRHPKGISLSANGRFLYVANSWSDTVSVMSAEPLKMLREIPVGFEPNGPSRTRKAVFFMWRTASATTCR